MILGYRHLEYLLLLQMLLIQICGHPRGVAAFLLLMLQEEQTCVVCCVHRLLDILQLASLHVLFSGSVALRAVSEWAFPRLFVEALLKAGHLGQVLALEAGLHEQVVLVVPLLTSVLSQIVDRGGLSHSLDLCTHGGVSDGGT